MAELCLEILCPGDWNNHPDAQSASEITDLICFKWDACLLVDRFIDDHSHRPDGKICIMWENPVAMREKYHRKGWGARYYPGTMKPQPLSSFSSDF